MMKQGLMHAAITAASIATFLATDASETPTYQHGSRSGRQQRLHLAGEIQRVSYTNLHTTIQIKADDRIWSVILASPLLLQQYGVSEAAFTIGQRIHLIGYLPQSGSSAVWAERMMVGDRMIELC